MATKIQRSNNYKSRIKDAYNKKHFTNIPFDVFKTVIHSQFKFATLAINNGEGINLKGFGRVGYDNALDLANKKYVELLHTNGTQEEIREMYTFLLGNKNVFNNVNTFSLRKAFDENGNALAITDKANLDKLVYKPYYTIEEINNL